MIALFLNSKSWYNNNSSSSVQNANWATFKLSLWQINEISWDNQYGRQTQQNRRLNSPNTNVCFPHFPSVWQLEGLIQIQSGSTKSYKWVARSKREATPSLSAHISYKLFLWVYPSVQNTFEYAKMLWPKYLLKPWCITTWNIIWIYLPSTYYYSSSV